jgi:asparagine synthetase B (glutamine-hydrolysing)
MAGIAGIVLKKEGSKSTDFKKAFNTMMAKLAARDSQLSHSGIYDTVCLGNVLPVSASANDHFQYNRQLEISVVIDGLVFVANNERRLLADTYNIDEHDTDYALIPFLYHLYKEDYVKHISGWFNIFIYDAKRGRSLLSNDYLGYLPLYYYDTPDCFVFASKIECIVVSGLMTSVGFDAVTIAEHLCFNYPLSDYSYIEGIKTLPNAVFINTFSKESRLKKYWSLAELFSYSPAGEDESIALMNDGIHTAVSKISGRFKNKINLSLTGGWDSRVVLSCFLPEFKDRLNVYSFGAASADDVLIPGVIAQNEHFKYTPYILDREYLDKSFIPNALKTIQLSNGTRNYKRTHYLFAIQQIAQVSDILVTGIFGDEVFKAAQAAGGLVFSPNLIELLQNDFNVEESVSRWVDTLFKIGLQTDSDRLKTGFSARLYALKEYLAGYKTTSEKYYALRFEINLRKYFGNEVNSYNDFVYCFSPFIDMDFLRNFARTKFMGIHYPFNSNHIKIKKQSTLLYYKITKQNYRPLIHYNSSRGFSMADAGNPLGNLKIFFKKFIRKSHSSDDFNTKSTDRLFAEYLQTLSPKEGLLPFRLENFNNPGKTADINSLIYWMHRITHF